LRYPFRYVVRVLRCKRCFLVPLLAPEVLHFCTYPPWSSKLICGAPWSTFLVQKGPTFLYDVPAGGPAQVAPWSPSLQRSYISVPSMVARRHGQKRPPRGDRRSLVHLPAKALHFCTRWRSSTYGLLRFACGNEFGKIAKCALLGRNTIVADLTCFGAPLVPPPPPL